MKKIYIITAVLVLLIGVVLSFALYSNSPVYKVKANNVYEEDENKSAVHETREKAIPYEMDENNSAVSKESDNSDGVPSRMNTSGDAARTENDILNDPGDDNDSINEGNYTDDGIIYETEGNENYEEHDLYSGIELEVERDFREISASSGTQTVHFYAETFIDTDKIILIDAGTGSTVATMVDDGRRSKNGDELMNDNVYTCKVDIDISKEKIYELYAVIGDNGSDSIVSNTVNIEVYQFTEKDIFDNDQVLSTIENLYRSDEFKSMDLDSKIETMYNLLVELSENGTPEAPYSLIERDSIYFDKEHNQYTFIIHRGGIVVIPLVEHDH